MCSHLAYPNFFEDESSYIKNFATTLNNEPSPLHRSIFEERAYLLGIQLEDPNIDVNIRNKNYESPLLAALRLQNKERSAELAAMILEIADVEVNLPDYHGDSPLHEVAKAEMPEQILTAILKKPKCQVNTRNYLGESPLHMTKSVTIAKILVEHGANVNMRDNSNNTPLHKQVKNTKICELLIEHGAVINVKNVNGFTALHEAVCQNVQETVTLLLNSGADANIETDFRNRITALQTAYKFRVNDSIKEQLWMHSKPLYLLFVASYDHRKIPQILEQWYQCGKTEDEVVDFLLNLIKIMKNSKELKYVTCGRLVARYFLNNIPMLSHQNNCKIIKKFSDYLGRSLLNFLLKTHNYKDGDDSKEIEKIVMTLLENGETLDYSDLEVIYLQLGDCLLLHDLTKFPVAARTRKFKDLPFFLKALCDVATDLTQLINTKSLSNIDVLDFYNIHNLARYSKLPKTLVRNFCDTYRNIIRFEKPNLFCETMQNCIHEIENNSGVPSLLELSRNAVRPILCKKYRVSKTNDLYFVLKEMRLPPLIISLIMMEFPLYYKIKAPEYFPYTRHAYLL